MDYNQQPYQPIPTPAAQTGNAHIFAIISLVLGIINLCAWFIPICGAPLAIIGLVLGYLGLKSDQRTLAIIGMILCGLGLVASIINGVLGAVLFAQNY